MVHHSIAVVITSFLTNFVEYAVSRRSSALPRSTALGLLWSAWPSRTPGGIGLNCVLRLAHSVRAWARDRSSCTEDPRLVRSPT